MNVIMLSGKSNCGKTTTLCKVYDFINPDKEDILKTKKKLGGNQRDFECIIRYNNKIVAFFTMGDYSGELIMAFKRYSAKCDYLICACNTRHKKPYEKIKGYKHVIIAKTIVNVKSQVAFDIANEDDKDRIIKNII